MLEIVFSDSACGSLKLAQHFGRGEYSGGCIGVILTHEDGSEPTQAEQDEALRQAEDTARHEWERSQPMGGSPGDVFGFGLGLSVGDISEEPPGPRRRQTLAALRSTFSLPDMEAQVDRLLRTSEQSLAEVLDRSAKGEALRVWYSDSPDEMCGFCWLMSRLEPLGEACGPVFAVKLPRYETREDQTTVSHSSWGDISPGEFYRYVPLAQPVSPLLRRTCAWHWNQLQRENAPLRATLNGRLVSLPADAYDSLIRREIAMAEPEFQEAQILGQVLSLELGIGDGLVASRIEALIEAGELEALTQPPEDGARYWRKLRCTEQFTAPYR